MKTRFIRCLCSFAFFALVPVSAFTETVSTKELHDEWDFFGIGLKKIERGMFYMKEEAGSQGVMIVSPESYAEDITVRYEIMPMNAASVCVVILSANGLGEETSLSFPKDYNGSMAYWVSNVHNYFFAFHNQSHDATPFVKRFPENASIARYSENVMNSGKFHTIEVGRSGTKIWLRINGKSVVDATDPNPLGSGHVAFRIRGLSEEPASCLIRNVVIGSP